MREVRRCTKIHGGGGMKKLVAGVAHGSIARRLGVPQLNGRSDVPQHGPAGMLVTHMNREHTDRQLPAFNFAPISQLPLCLVIDLPSHISLQRFYRPVLGCGTGVRLLHVLLTAFLLSVVNPWPPKGFVCITASASIPSLLIVRLHVV